MKLITFTSLYPNAEMPSHGIFVENRLRHLVAGGRVEARVIAPLPWFPLGHPMFGNYARLARVPGREQRAGIEIEHPRYLTVPGIGMYSAPLAMAIGARPSMARLRRTGFDFDAIDAHYFYPDGVAAALLARWFDRPLVITARGSDVTQLPGHAAPRAMIRWAARQADAIVTVSRSLETALVELGVDADKIEVLRNGVDLAAFRPMVRTEARARLGLATGGRVVASVGHLIPRKGHQLVVEAIATIPDATLLIAGSGPEQGALVDRVARLGLSDRVRFLGQLAPADLPTVYGAADVLVLASSNEGWANVLLEAMACGTPVVATDVGGSGEVVTSPDAGVLLGERTPAAIAAGLRHLFDHPPAPGATRRYAERFSWDDTTRGQERIFDRLRASTDLGLEPS